MHSKRIYLLCLLSISPARARNESEVVKTRSKGAEGRKGKEKYTENCSNNVREKRNTNGKYQ